TTPTHCSGTTGSSASRPARTTRPRAASPSGPSGRSTASGRRSPGSCWASPAMTRSRRVSRPPTPWSTASLVDPRNIVVLERGIPPPTGDENAHPRSKPRIKLHDPPTFHGEQGPNEWTTRLGRRSAGVAIAAGTRLRASHLSLALAGRDGELERR